MREEEAKRIPLGYVSRTYGPCLLCGGYSIAIVQRKGIEPEPGRCENRALPGEEYNVQGSGPKCGLELPLIHVEEG